METYFSQNSSRILTQKKVQCTITRKEIAFNNNGTAVKCHSLQGAERSLGFNHIGRRVLGFGSQLRTCTAASCKTQPPYWSQSLFHFSLK